LLHLFHLENFANTSYSNRRILGCQHCSLMLNTGPNSKENIILSLEM
jgi:hypothetical protein